MATSAATSPLDLNALKQAVDLVGKSRSDEAANLENTISDPLARKLIEWLVLRSDDTTAAFARYAAFIAANPSWPSIVTLRRRAEAMLWQERSDPTTVLAFFKTDPPRTAKGKFALARALLSQGDSAGAHQTISDAWRSDAFSGDLEAQVRDMFAGLITADDDKARMDARLYAEDDDAGMRAAHHLDTTQLAIAKARAAVINKAGNAKALLEAVPAAAQHDAGYIFSRAQFLRRGDKIDEAGRWMISAPHDPAVLRDVDQWWVERRVLARKLLDLGNVKMAYEVANGTAPPNSENFRADQQFTSGWIALTFLHEPAVALAHFAHISEGVSNPITLARAFYWQGRAAEAAGHDHDARGYYDSAARFPTAYYGQLARARLDLTEVTLRPLPAPTPDLHGLEAARVFEMLYAVDARDVVASMAADLADKANDPAALTTLAEIAKQHNDARATLLIGKTALGRGFPLELYAFPDFGVPDFQPIGPDVARYVVYSIARQESAFNPKIVSPANAYGLMQVTPAAARDTAKRFNVTFDQRRLANDRHLQCPARRGGAWQRPRILPRLLHSGIRRLQCRPRPGQGLDRAIWRSARSKSRPDRLDRAHSDLGDALLRPARAREHAGLPRPLRQRLTAVDRRRPAPRQLTAPIVDASVTAAPVRLAAGAIKSRDGQGKRSLQAISEWPEGCERWTNPFR